MAVLREASKPSPHRRLALTLMATILGCGGRSASSPPAAAGAPPEVSSSSGARVDPGAVRTTTPPPRTTPLGAAQVDADLDVLTRALERAYGGYGFVPTEAWQQTLAQLKALGGHPSTIQALCNGIEAALAELSDPQIGAFYGDRCGAPRPQGAVGRSYIDGETSAWGFDQLSVGMARFDVIALRELPFARSADWMELADAIEAAKASSGILVDLRGVHGGDETRGLELARALADAEVTTKGLRSHHRETTEAATLSSNPLDGDEAPASRPSSAEPSRAREVPGSRAYRGPVAVLIDGDCVGNCETVLEALRRDSHAKVFGQRTGGGVRSRDVGLLSLPASHVTVHVPTTFLESPSVAPPGHAGLDPDVQVAPGSDAFDAAMAFLVALTPNARPVAVDDFEVPEQERQAEQRRLESLGVDTKGRAVVARKPFATPYTRHSFVVPQAWFESTGSSRRVYAPALLADLDALEGVIRRGYGGFEVAKKRGWNWTAWFDSFRSSLHRAGSRWLDTRVAFDPIRRYEEAVLDNHTTIPLSLRFGSGSRSWVLASVPTAQCSAWRDAHGDEHPLPTADAATHVKTVQRFDGHELGKSAYVVMPATNAPGAVRCGAEWLALHPAEAPDDTNAAMNLRALSGHDDKPWLGHLSADVAYLRLPTFSKENHETRDREQASWDHPNEHERALLVDLRGNDGGDADLEALSGWVDEGALETASALASTLGASCLYPALRWGYTTESSRGLRPPLTDEMRWMLQQGVDALEGRDASGCPPKWVTTKGSAPAYQARRRGAGSSRKIVVIVDAGCASDCEYMTRTLATLPGAIVVGVNTFGVAQYIQPGYSVLPNTRLPFRIALGTSNIYGDDRSFDGYGLDVDVLLDGDAAWTKKGILSLVDAVAPAPKGTP